MTLVNSKLQDKVNSSNNFYSQVLEFCDYTALKINCMKNLELMRLHFSPQQRQEKTASSDALFLSTYVDLLHGIKICPKTKLNGQIA